MRTVYKMFIFFIFLLCISLTSFKKSGKRQSCAHRYIGGGVTKSDVSEIVTKHNNLRKLIANGQVRGQPRGINLRRLKWDRDLAVAAQRIADTCVFEHVSVDDSRWYVGQNLYMSMSSVSSSSPEWGDAVQAWFDEHEMYVYDAQVSSPGTGHYTQVIWATTTHIGCGYTSYETNGYMGYEQLYVCNYGEGGNYVGELPYLTGDGGCENLC